MHGKQKDPNITVKMISQDDRQSIREKIQYLENKLQQKDAENRILKKTSQDLSDCNQALAQSNNKLSEANTELTRANQKLTNANERLREDVEKSAGFDSKDESNSH